MNHTPIPWKAEGKRIYQDAPNPYAAPQIATVDESCTGERLMDETKAANAAFIVRACNAHEALLAAAKLTVDRFNALNMPELKKAIALAEAGKDGAA